MKYVVVSDSQAAEDKAGLAAARDQFEAYGRQMVAFVDDEMPIVADDIIDFALANQALDQGDVDLTFRFATALNESPVEPAMTTEKITPVQHRRFP